MSLEFLSAVVLLLLVTDPFGNVPLVNAMLSGVAPARRRAVIARECAIAYVLLMAFMLFGRKVLEIMRLSETSLSIAGGVILFMIAIRMVFPGTGGSLGEAAAGEPFLVPLAIPFIAGPSALATVMLMATREPERLLMWGLAVTLAMALVTVILLAGEKLERLLGDRVMEAIGRLMGLILTAMAVEMLLGGIRAFVAGLR